MSLRARLGTARLTAMPADPDRPRITPRTWSLSLGSIPKFRRTTRPPLSVSLLFLVLACERTTPGPPRVPPVLAPAFALLDSSLSRADRDALRRTLPDSAILYHLSLGRWLRNTGDLWKGGPVAESLRAHGVNHPDDMAQVILQAYGLYLRGKPINLDSLVRQLPPAPKVESYEVPATHADSETKQSDSSAVAMVARLYRDRACEAVSGEPACADTALLEQSREGLSRYFDSTLVTLLLKDRACAKSSHAVCRLDYSPIWDSQDPAATDVKVTGTSDSNVVAVAFRYSTKGELIELTYRMARTSGGWRVHDIVSARTHSSLLATLRGPGESH